MVTDGRLVVLGPGSYRVGGAPDCLEARVLGVIESLDGQAWASHRTAAVLDRAIEEALRARLCTIGSLYRVLAELGGRGRPGTVKMRSALATRGLDHRPTKSDLELIGRALLADLPGIEWEVPMADEQGFIRSIDARVAHAHLVVEFDGRAFHSRPEDVERDAAEAARLIALGNVVLRLTWGGRGGGGGSVGSGGWRGGSLSWLGCR